MAEARRAAAAEAVAASEAAAAAVAYTAKLQKYAALAPEGEPDMTSDVAESPTRALEAVLADVSDTHSKPLAGSAKALGALYLGGGDSIVGGGVPGPALVEAGCDPGDPAEDLGAANHSPRRVEVGESSRRVLSPHRESELWRETQRLLQQPPSPPAQTDAQQILEYSERIGAGGGETVQREIASHSVQSATVEMNWVTPPLAGAGGDAVASKKSSESSGGLGSFVVWWWARACPFSALK
jgi:hypothetical protein